MTRIRKNFKTEQTTMKVTQPLRMSHMERKQTLDADEANEMNDADATINVSCETLKPAAAYSGTFLRQIFHTF